MRLSEVVVVVAFILWEGLVSSSWLLDEDSAGVFFFSSGDLTGGKEQHATGQLTFPYLPI